MFKTKRFEYNDDHRFKRIRTNARGHTVVENRTDARQECCSRTILCIYYRVVRAKNGEIYTYYLGTI